MNRLEEVTIRTELPIVLEEGPTSWGVFVPALPGCISGGRSREEALENIQEALKLHLWAIHRDELAADALTEGDVDLKRLADQVNETMTLDDAAKLAGVSPSAITNAIRQGRLTTMIAPPEARPARGRRTRLVYRAEIERWRERRGQRLLRQLTRLAKAPPPNLATSKL
jgi:predicted RNase H-like HicB family nuclease